MRKISIPLRIILLVTAGLLLAGCADIRQEITIAADGQITCSQQISTDDPTAALAGQDPILQALLGKVQPVDLQFGGVTYRAAAQDGQWIYRAETAPADLSDCPGMPSSRRNALLLLPAGGHRTQFIGRLAFTITDVKGWVSSALEATVGKLAADQLANRFEDSMLSGHAWTIVLHAPGQVVSTNGKLDRLTNTVTWEIPLSEFVGVDAPARTLEAVYLPPGTNPRSGTGWANCRRCI